MFVKQVQFLIELVWIHPEELELNPILRSLSFIFLELKTQKVDLLHSVQVVSCKLGLEKLLRCLCSSRKHDTEISFSISELGSVNANSL